MTEAFVVADSAGVSWKGRHIPCPVCGGDGNRELFKLVKSDCIPKRPADRFVRCQNCGLVYINPRILFPLEQVEESSEISPPDVEFEATARLSGFELQEDLERIRKYKPAGHLLEIGCGNGTFLSLACQAGYQTKGVEPRGDYATYARDRFGLDVIQGLVGDPRQSVELPAHWFDVIVMLHVIEHVLDVRQVVQAVHKYLRPGGIFYLTTPNVTSPYARLYGSRWSHYHVCWHHQFFSERTLRYLLSQQGFQVFARWGVYRGRPIRWRRMIKLLLATVGISLDVIAMLAQKM